MYMLSVVDADWRITARRRFLPPIISKSQCVGRLHGVFCAYVTHSGSVALMHLKINFKSLFFLNKDVL